MPYMLRLTDDGISIHGSEVGDGYVTHGCIGVPTAFARKLFAAVKLGDTVIVTRGEPHALGVGWYWNMFGQHIYQYPVYTSTYTWTRNASEQSTTNEEFNFQDRNGLSMSADVAASFSVDPDRASVLFQKYRTETTGIIAGPLRNAVRDALVTRAAQLGVEEIYGLRKAELIRLAEADTRAFMAPSGCAWSGSTGPPTSACRTPCASRSSR